MADPPPNDGKSKTPPESTRREFFGGRAAAKALSHWLGPSESAKKDTQAKGADPSEWRQANLLVEFSRNAMATEFQVVLDAQKHAAGPDAAMTALDEIDRLEDQLSVYRHHSDVSELNRTAFREAVSVDWDLFALLEIGVSLWQLSGGAFDMTAGPLSRVWGFHRRRGKWPDAKALDEAKEQVGSDAIQLDAANRTVRFGREGCEINLGAIGKGWALDQAAHLIELEGVDDFILHGGQSSLLSRGARHQQQGWQVGLMHPLIPSQRLGTLTLHDQAIGTSGCGNQFFHHQGKRLSHILDPRTGLPAEGVLSATVVAPTATEADALATACYVMGVEEARHMLRQREDLGALLVVPGKKAGAIEIVSIQLPEGCWQTA